MKTYIITFLLLGLNVCSYGQQIFKNPSDAFESSIIGDTLFFKVVRTPEFKFIPVPNKGLAKDRKAMEGLIANLKTQYFFELTKKKGSDETKMTLSNRIAFSYDAVMLFDSTTTYKDSVIRYQLQALSYARKTKNIDLTNEIYAALTRSQDVSVAQRIRFLKEWIRDYNAWAYKTDETTMLSIPHIMLADTYKRIGAEEDAEKTVKELLITTFEANVKAIAHKWLVEFYKENDKLTESVKHLFEFIKYFKPKENNDIDAVTLANAYSDIVINKIKSNDLDEALSLIPKIDVLEFCKTCANSTFVKNGIHKNVRNMYSAQIYIAKKEAGKAIEYLKQIPPKSLNQTIIDKTWSDYYILIGDTLNAYTHIASFAKLIEASNKNMLSNYRQMSKQSFDFAKSYETASINEKAEQDRLLQAQKLIAVEKQNELDKLKAETENELLLSRAEQAELEKTVEKERLESVAAQSKKEQDFKISLLNQDIDAQKRIRLWLIGGLSLFSLFLGILFFQNKIKQRLNKLLVERNQAIEQQHGKLEKTLSELKSTQIQLIQKEKLASLGELTAGIAHEIQNPLNFVNNFSELSVDLVKDLKDELKRPDKDESYIDELFDDLSQNQEKINHHGKRASSIVKGMLEHSRASTGVKELTDINKLADEYLRLSYHGLRAKDKDFNCEIKTEFDENLPKINIIPQDIGRVLLNLINNAFYAVKPPLAPPKGGDYIPQVIVSTRYTPPPLGGQGGLVTISVKDNGIGMSEATKVKIFQPFFTTKPPGQGTGLGLSLAYDIVTKGHGGTLEVVSTEGVGSTFILTLSI